MLVVFADEQVDLLIRHPGAGGELLAVGLHLLPGDVLALQGHLLLDLVVLLRGLQALFVGARGVHHDLALLLGGERELAFGKGEGVVALEDLVEHPGDLLSVLIGVLHVLDHLVPALAGRDVRDEGAVGILPTGGLEFPFVADELRLRDHILREAAEEREGAGDDAGPADLAEESAEDLLALTALIFQLLHPGAQLLDGLRRGLVFLRVRAGLPHLLVGLPVGGLQLVKRRSGDVVDDLLVALRLLVQVFLRLLQGDELLLRGLEFLRVDALLLRQTCHFLPDLCSFGAGLFEAGIRFGIVQGDD